MMKRLSFLGMLLLSAAFLFTSCQPKANDEGKVHFIDRDVDVLSFLEGFPYSTYGFYLSDDASRLLYVKQADGNPLMMLKLDESTDISQGKVISDADWAARNLWSPNFNEKDGCMYWMGDQSNDEKIDLYRMNPPQDARILKKSNQLLVLAMNGSLLTTQPADTDGKKPQRLPSVKILEPS